MNSSPHFYEVNFDGLIGPSHNYAGLSVGNLASQKNAQHSSQPKQAALQGLEKMRTLITLGYQQGFLPPQQRPRIEILRNLGFSGSNVQVLNKVGRSAPELLPLVYSASSMWAANAATVTPSPDTADGRVHFTPANLLTAAHRSIEHSETYRDLTTVFADDHFFMVHPALHAHSDFADEGAANHSRLCRSYGAPGVGLFVYGRSRKASAERSANNTSEHFPARQTLAACEAVARQHDIATATAFLAQNIDAIDAGAFHNDVVAVANGPVLFFHEDAFEASQQAKIFSQIADNLDFVPVCVPRLSVSLKDAVASYLFNSQLLAQPDGDMSNMRLLAPIECEENSAVRGALARIMEDTANPINQVSYVDVRQSMSNGGGPACLRLRVVLSAPQLQAVNSRFLLDSHKIDTLQEWVRRNYRDTIAPRDLADPDLMNDCYHALDQLTQCLSLGSYYDFQR